MNDITVVNCIFMHNPGMIDPASPAYPYLLEKLVTIVSAAATLAVIGMFALYCWVRSRSKSDER